MKKNKQWMGATSIVLVGLVVFLGFQNCAQDRGVAYVPSNSTYSTTPIPSSTPYVPRVTPTPSPVVSATPVPGVYIIKPNSNVVFKIPKPSSMTNPSDYYWMIPSHQNRLVVYYGNIVLDSTGQYMLINITTRSNNSATTSLTLNFYNKNTKVYLNESFAIKIDGSAVESLDNVAELCTRADITKMTFWVNRSALTVINFFDEGSGIASYQCKFGASQAVADCLDGAKWSTDWRNYPIEITLWNRCDKYVTQVFQP